MRASRFSLAAAAATLALTTAACGSDESDPPAPAATQTDAMTMSGEGMDMSAGGGEMAGMKKLAAAAPGDLDVEVYAMPPERFFVSEGDGLREQTPAEGDDAHLMVTLADKESGVRLPDATVTARVTDAEGETAFEGPLYPMIGRGMGLHYGENVDVGEAGDYDVTLTVGPPRIGRHRAVETAWTKTTKVEQKVSFDGKTFSPR